MSGAALEARAQPPAREDTATAANASGEGGEPRTLPQDGLFSSIKQSLRESDQDIIRGHFEVGSPPNVRRYYCLIDPKSHRREPNGVLGDPIPRSDGMTGIKSSAVSLYRCEKAEQQGMLVTTGYTVPPSSVPQAVVPAVAAPAVVVPAVAAPAVPATAPAPVSRFSSGMIDISGLRLGMTADEVRAVLLSKGLRDRNESSENLSYRDSTTGKMKLIAHGRFVNVIAVSSPASAAAGGNDEIDGESFEVMFTPVPGHERVMAIVHTVGYSASNAVHESALDEGLVAKYGGFVDAGVLPPSATWRYQADGAVAVGDSCGRRDLFGGLRTLRASTAHENIALQRAADELEFEVQHCGIAMVTEDHHTANGGALRGERLVTRYTVTAYSPALAREGAALAESMLRSAGDSDRDPAGAPPKDPHVPDL